MNPAEKEVIVLNGLLDIAKELKEMNRLKRIQILNMSPRDIDIDEDLVGEIKHE